MKLILTPEEQAEAINDWIFSNYGIPLEVSSDTLEEISIDTKAVCETKVNLSTVQVDKVFEEDTHVEEYQQDDTQTDYRDRVIKQAEQLGIKFRSDIKTETLEERIEEYVQERKALMLEAEELGLDNLTDLDNNELQNRINEQIELMQEQEEEDLDESPVPVATEPKKKRSIFGD